MKRVAVVGGGLAGMEAVSALRADGYDGAITLVAAEPHLPYDRPPLSKEVLAGAVDATDLEADWDDLDVDVRSGCRATGLREDHLVTDTGDVRFDGLVVATGTSP